MNLLIWIFQVLLGLWFVQPAFMKLATTKEKMIAQKNLPPDVNLVPIRILGVLEMLGIIGIIVPQLTGVSPVLTAITAICFALVMTGAFFVHLKKKEYKILPLISLAFILSVVVAYYRF